MTMVEDLYIFSKVVEPLLIQCFLILSIQGSRGFEILFQTVSFKSEYYSVTFLLHKCVITLANY